MNSKLIALTSLIALIMITAGFLGTDLINKEQIGSQFLEKVQQEKQQIGLDSNLDQQFAQLEFAYDEQCRMGDGYTPSKGCSGSSPLEQQEDELPSHRTPIKQTLTQFSILTSSSQIDDFLSNEASIKGSGWGMKASASLKFITQNCKTTNSMSFLGSVFQLNENIKLITSQVKLSPGAKQILKEDPIKFYKTYGEYVVIGYTDGAELVSSYSLSSQNEDSLRDIEAAVSSHYNTGFGFSAQGADIFKSKLQEHKSDVQVVYKQQVKGSDIKNFTIENAQEQIAHFADHITPKRMKLFVAEWQSVPDFMDTVMQIKIKEKRDKYLLYQISPEILQSVTTSYSEIKYLQNEIQGILQKYDLSDQLQSDLEDFLQNKIKISLTKIETIDDFQLREFTKNPDSYFLSIYYSRPLKQEWKLEYQNRVMEEIYNLHGTNIFGEISGEGERFRKQYVQFQIPYRHVPKVLVNLNQFEFGNRHDGRITVSPQDITKNGFNIQYRTWGDTLIYSVGVTWMAYD